MAPSLNNKTNKIAISGSTGFIGNSLSQFFKNNMYQIVPIQRRDIAKGSAHVASLIKGCEIVINLSGATILKRWTPNYKSEIFNSRINTTRCLVDAIAKMDTKPTTFISTSAVGIYEPIDSHDEFSDRLANDFLGDVCRAWEAEATNIMQFSDVRLIIFRLGVVLAKNNGAFPKIIKPMNFFVGGKIADGFQWFPFIHVNDLLSAYWYVINNPNCKGIYNLTAPNPIINQEFTKLLATKIHRPYFFTVPKWLLKLLYGEAETVLTQGQNANPLRLINDGFDFEFPTASKAIDQLIN